MTQARQATPDDAPELVRLRGVMLGSISGDEPPPGPWQDHAELSLRTRLAQPDGFLTAFVVDRPGGPGKLAACMAALMAWFAERGVRKIDLKASPEGEPLYASLGFARTADPAMRFRP